MCLSVALVSHEERHQVVPQHDFISFRNRADSDLVLRSSIIATFSMPVGG